MHEQQIQLNRDISSVNSNGVQIQKDTNRKYIHELLEFLEDLNIIFADKPFNWEEIQ